MFKHRWIKLKLLHLPDYKINVWDFKGTKVNSIIPALYANNVSLTTRDSLIYLTCKSNYKVEINYQNDERPFS